MTTTPESWPELSRLLDQALELPPAERQGWIESLPPEDTHLREALREILLRAPERAGPDFLARLPPVAHAPAPAAAADHAPGDEVGPYRLLSPLGSGGMASVWLAERSHGGPARRVALKLLRWTPDPEALSRRMERERDALAALEHPHIARLYDAGIDEAGQAWLAMEYVDGAPLDRYARERALPLRERLELFLQVAQAVAYAHSRLVVHRDLKPPNILVTAEGQVRLLDFGIAKLLDDGKPGPAPDPLESSGTAAESGAETVAETMTRAFTPAYAAPEQVSGAAITVATDVYALGVVLFELLTGQRPFRNPGGRTRALERAILESEAPRPSEVAGSALRKRLRGDLDAIVARALEKDPGDRYASVGDLAQDLRRHLREEPVLARPDGAWYRGRKFLLRHRLGAAAAGAVALALVAGLLTTLWQARRALAERDRAQVLLSRSAAVMEAMDFLIGQAAARLDGEALQGLLRQSAEASRASHAGSPELEALVLLSLAGYQETVNDRARALAFLDRAGELLRGSTDRDLEAQLACQRAVWAQDSEDAGAVLASIAPLGTDLSLDPRTRIACLTQASLLAQHLEEAEVVLRHAQGAQAALGAVTSPSPRLRARVLVRLGDAETMAGRFREGEAHLEEALALLGAAGLEQSMEALDAHNSLAEHLFATGAMRSALPHVEAILRGFAGRTPPDAVLSNHAYGLEATGRFEEALRVHLRSAELARKNGNAWVEVNGLVGAASALRKLGRLAEARRRLEEAERLTEGLAPGAPARLYRLFTLGQLQLDEGRLDEAERTVAQLLASGAPDSPGARRNALRLRAELRVARGRFEEARPDAEGLLAEAIRGQVPGRHSSAVGRAQALLGRIEERAGRKAEAIAAWQAAREHLAESQDPGHPETREAEAALARLAAGR